MAFGILSHFARLTLVVAVICIGAHESPAPAAEATQTLAEAQEAAQEKVTKDLATQVKQDAALKEMQPFGVGIPADAWALSRGESCKGSEMVREPCPDLPVCIGGDVCHPVDCSLEAWSDWNSDFCTGLCERHRIVALPNNRCGEPCRGTLVETKNDTMCFTCKHPKKVDCVWGDWSSWSNCSAACGGGQSKRHRDVVVSPDNGGELCKDLTREEIAPCNVKACDRECVDGEWGNWADWSDCSHSCGGGTRLRSRLIAVQADDCGVSATGRSQEFKACNSHISCEEDFDCVFAAWTQWSACSCTCDGVMRRSRRIASYGQGRGKWCLGSTKEIMPCNPAPGDYFPTEGCHVAEPVDCEMGDWDDWTQCTATCGAGQRDRRRQVTTEPKSSGKPCTGPLSETGGCGERPCRDNSPVDCLWGDWSGWGACDKCGGEKRRYRQIQHMPKFGGRACDYQASEEFAACARSCHERTYCSWMEWSDWQSCTVSCGDGSRTRRRELGRATEQPLQTQYEELQVRTEQIEANRMQEVLAAFSAGSVSFALMMGSVRMLRLFRRRTSQDRAYSHVDAGVGVGSELLE